MQQFIGLSGYAQSGKDTIAGYLKEDGWVRISFADTLRDAVYALNPIISTESFGPYSYTRTRDVVDKIGWERAKLQFAELRSQLQRIGTEVGREMLGEDVWVEAALRKCTDRDGKYVFTDCRFPNEASMVKKNGGVMVRVTRPGRLPVNAHSSEIALDEWPFDATILNDTGLEALRAGSLALADFQRSQNAWAGGKQGYFVGADA